MDKESVYELIDKTMQTITGYKTRLDHLVDLGEDDLVGKLADEWAQLLFDTSRTLERESKIAEDPDDREEYLRMSRGFLELYEGMIDSRKACILPSALPAESELVGEILSPDREINGSGK